MTLTLSIRNVDHLDNGMPTEIVLDRRGVTIGRAPTCDWSLPDPHRFISSRHCEISFTGDAYVLLDTSTNGTFLNGAPERMRGERRIEHGDHLQIGHYLVVAALSGGALADPVGPPGSSGDAGWGGWDSHLPAPSAPPPPTDSLDDWGAPPVDPAASLGGGGASASWHPAETTPAEGGMRWGAPPVAPAAPRQAGGWAPSHHLPELPVASVWRGQEPPPDPASAWSSAAPDRPPAPSPDDVWGKIVEGNVVDWARSGFGSPQPPRRDPLGLGDPAGAAAALPKATPRPASFEAPGAVQLPPPVAPPPAPPPRSAAPDQTALLAAFLAAAGVPETEVKQRSPELIAKAGGLLRRLVAGLVVLVEARARAKSQMGAESTRLEFDGNNPLKFARSPEQALAMLLNPKERGFMEAERAVEDAFFDLQSHQMATLKAMQGALKATLDRFSPDAIRRRAEHRGLAKILPAARDAALWQSYEREFSGVAQGSDEAFMDVFAKEFRKAYEEQARGRGG